MIIQNILYTIASHIIPFSGENQQESQLFIFFNNKMAIPRRLREKIKTFIKNQFHFNAFSKSFESRLLFEKIIVSITP